MGVARGERLFHATHDLKDVAENRLAARAGAMTAKVDVKGDVAKAEAKKAEKARKQAEKKAKKGGGAEAARAHLLDPLAHGRVEDAAAVGRP